VHLPLSRSKSGVEAGAKDDYDDTPSDASWGQSSDSSPQNTASQSVEGLALGSETGVGAFASSTSRPTHSSSGLHLLLSKVGSLEKDVRILAQGFRKQEKSLKGAAKHADLEKLSRITARSTELEAMAQAAIGRGEVRRAMGHLEEKVLDEVSAVSRRIAALEERSRSGDEQSEHIQQTQDQEIKRQQALHEEERRRFEVRVAEAEKLARAAANDADRATRAVAGSSISRAAFGPSGSYASAPSIRQDEFALGSSSQLFSLEQKINDAISRSQ